jgi:phosphoribosylglycinamide formyltransferase-1
MPSTLNTLFCISGGGTTLQSILNAINAGELRGIRCGLVLATRPDAGGIKKAIDAGVSEKDIIVLPRSDYPDERFAERILAECDARHIDAMSQNGLIRRMPAVVVEHFRGMSINQHPGALDTEHGYDFGGKGMMGRAVIAATLYFAQMTNTNWWMEATAHQVDTQIDTGQVVMSQRVPLQYTDTVETAQARLLPVEHRVQIKALRKLAMRGYTQPLPLRHSPLIPPYLRNKLAEAKQRAIADYPHG